MTIYHDDKFGDDEEETLDFREEEPSSGKEQIALIPFWTPARLPEPKILPGVIRLPWPLRCSEVIRFTVLVLEYWMSPGGTLREWIKLNVCLGIILAASSLLLIPPMAALLSGGVEASVSFHEIVANLSKAALCVPPAVIAIAGLVLLYRVLQRSRRFRRRFDYDRYE